MRWIVIGLGLLLPGLLLATDSPLVNHPSPYLAMHAKDPVRWHLWSKHTLQKAKQQNKLLYVSVGYFACHWCHVMQRESYKNVEIAKLINELAIPVKVDRELQPGLDAALMEFVQQTLGQGGWPLNVILSPDGNPLIGFIYLPPENFQTLLTQLTAEWQANQSQLLKIADQAAINMAAQQKPLISTEIRKKLAKQYAETLVSHAILNADELAGGFGQQSKFPMSPILYALVCHHDRNPNQRLANFLVTTLNQMASQGMRDHLSGGFFRYTVDPNWQTPHFEKMLYDNAQLAQLFLVASIVFNKKLYRDVADDTYRFIIKAFASGKGGYIASFSAVDDEGIEGGYYLFEIDKLAKQISAQELNVAKLAWQLNSHTLEHGALPIPGLHGDSLAKKLNLANAEGQKLELSVRNRLLQLRAKRSLPKDDKTIAGWNGLLLASLSQASGLTGDPEYKKAARALRNRLISVHMDGKHLYKMPKSRGKIAEVSLQDYAYVAKGLVNWSHAHGDRKDLTLAMVLVKEAWQRFYNKQGWHQADDLMLTWAPRQASLSDGPLPSASSVLIQVSLDLAQALNNKDLKKRAYNALGLAQDQLVNDPFWQATRVKTMADQFMPPKKHCT